MSPELLPYQQSLIEVICAQISDKEKSVMQMSKNSGHQDTRFYLNIYRMEIERVKYLLKSYLRSRIIKIENQLIYIIEKDQAHLLSQSEMEYAWNLSEAKKEVYQKDFFNKIGT